MPKWPGLKETEVHQDPLLDVCWLFVGVVGLVFVLFDPLLWGWYKFNLLCCLNFLYSVLSMDAFFSLWFCHYHVKFVRLINVTVFFLVPCSNWRCCRKSGSKKAGHTDSVQAWWRSSGMNFGWGCLAKFFCSMWCWELSDAISTNLPIGFKKSAYLPTFTPKINHLCS